jgi:hypothetical protein
MTSRDIYIVGLRLLAVQFVVFGLAALPSAFLAFDAAENSGNSGTVAYGFISASGPLLMVLAGAFLAYRSRVPTVDIAGVADSNSFFIAGVRLLGLWLGISGAAGFLGAAADAAIISSGWSIRATDLLSSAVLLGAGGLLFARPALVSRAAK